MRHQQIFYRTIVIFGHVIVATWLAMSTTTLRAQDLEPRAYSNAPVGVNFVAAGYQNSQGAILFDPALPITDADADIDMGFVGYARTLGIAGRSAKAGFVLAYADLAGAGYVNGDYRTRNTAGLADPAFAFTINLSGAPAMSLEEFKRYQQATVIGFTFKVTAPWGVYEKEKLINIGTNRWSFKPELGIAKSFERWTFEAAAAGTFHTDNDEFNTNQTRQQDPIYSMQGHAVYAFAKGIWAAVSATYYTGGRTSLDGVDKNDLQQNWRTGFTLAIPIDRNNSIKLFGSSGVSTRTGTDYDALGLAWQYRWGAGL